MTTLALVGVGKWGKNYLTTVARIPGCRIAYVSTLTGRVLPLGKNITLVKHYQDLIRFSDIDGVIIATPASTHFEIVSFFLEHGINLLVEKPLTTNYRDAQKLEAASLKSSAIVLVGHVHLYNPAYRQVKALLGTVGKLVCIESEGCNFGPFRRDISALWDWAPHDISICLNLLGREPQEVRAWSVRTRLSGRETDDLIFVRLVFDQLPVLMKVGWLSAEKKRLLTITGTEGTIIFDDTANHRKITFTKWTEPAKKIFPTYDQTPPLVVQLREFMSSVHTHVQPRTNLRHGVKVIKIIDAIERSLRSGRSIRLS